MGESDRRFWRRHPGDVVRLVVRSVVLAVLLALTAAFPHGVGRVSINLVDLFAELPDAFRYALVGFAQILIVAIPLAILALLYLRRSALEAAMVLGSAIAGGVLMALLTDWLVRAAPPGATSGLPSSSFLSTDFPSPAYLAALVAGAATASPLLPDAWRRVAWGGVLAAALVRFLSATQAPVSVLVTIALGAVVGSAVLVAFGSPRRRPGAMSLRTDLALGGFDVDDLHDESESAGRRSYLGTSGGRPIEVVYIDRDDRDVDLLARAVRTIRVRDVDEESLSAQPDQRVQHHAVVTLMAEQAGARVPKVYAVVPAARESALIALDAVTGTTLAELRRRGRERGRARRPLASARSAPRRQDRPSLADAVESRDRRRHGVALRVGERPPRRRRRVARGRRRRVARDDGARRRHRAGGRRRRAHRRITTSSQAALAFVQSPALPPQTRKAAKKPKGFITDVRTALQTELGVEQVELAELERISVPKVLTWVGFAVLTFFLLGLASNWSEISSEMQGLNWWWVVPILIVTLLGPVSGAVSMMGSVLRPLALGDTTIVMYGQSFLNRFTPMNAGGMAMRIRYLQKGGTDVTVATAAIGLTSAASGVVQVLYMAFFILWSSTDPTDDTQGSGGSSSSDGVAATVIIVVIIAIVLAALVFALTPKLRQLGDQVRQVDDLEDPSRFR